MSKVKKPSFLYTLEKTTRALSGQAQLNIIFGKAEAAIADTANTLVLEPIPEGCTKMQALKAVVEANQKAFLLRYGALHSLQKKLKIDDAFFNEVILPLELSRTQNLGETDFIGTRENSVTVRNDFYKKKATSPVPPSVVEVLAFALRTHPTPAEKAYFERHKNLTPELNSWLKDAAPYLNDLAHQHAAYADLLVLLDSQKTPQLPQQPPIEEEIQAPNTAPENEATQNEVEHHGQAKTGQIKEEVEGQDEAPQHVQTEEGGASSYKAFSKEYDSTEKAFKNISLKEQTRLKEKYKQIKAHTQPLVRPLVRKLQNKLLAQNPSAWQLDQEEGVLDPQKLPQVITSANQAPYKTVKPHKNLDTTITLLLDNSGSMRGRPIEITAVCADVLTQTLEQCGIHTEVLGFTTAAWKGGQVRKKWLDSGIQNPGRLNELRHIIYKDAANPYKAAYSGFAMMLADDLLKENIDGESLLWAYSRQLKRPEKRKILIVISDGAPVDYATDKNNVPNYLSNHLKSVIAMVDAHKKVELLAIGVGHDVGQYYKNAVVIENSADLGTVLVDKLVELFSKR